MYELAVISRPKQKVQKMLEPFRGKKYSSYASMYDLERLEGLRTRSGEKVWTALIKDAVFPDSDARYFEALYMAGNSKSVERDYVRCCGSVEAGARALSKFGTIRVLTPDGEWHEPEEYTEEELIEWHEKWVERFIKPYPGYYVLTLVECF